MKNIFAVNQDWEDRIEGQVFLQEEVTDEQKHQLENFDKELEETVEKAHLPRPLRILTGALMIGWVVPVLLAVELWADEESEMLSVIWPVLAAVAAVCLAGWLVLVITQHRRNKQVLESVEVQQLETHADAVGASSRLQLDIPADAASVDVLSFVYKEKNGKQKVTHRMLCAYLNMDLFVFVQDGALCLANSYQKYGIPLDSITGVRHVKKRTETMSWNKEEKPKSPRYKPYKIGYNEENDLLTIRGYYAVEITWQGEDYELLVPDYDWEIVGPLLGDPVVTEE